MPNIAKILKDEIQRLARKETRAFSGQLKKDMVVFKKTVAAVRKRLVQMERTLKGLQKVSRRLEGRVVQEAPELPETFRISSKGIRSLRRKLKLSQADLAKLVGVSSQSVYQWERKGGRLALRKETKKALGEIRKLGIKDVKKRLES